MALRRLFTVLTFAILALLVSAGAASAKGNTLTFQEHFNIDSTTPDGWHYEGKGHFVFHQATNNQGTSTRTLNHSNLKGTVTAPDGTKYNWIGNLKEAGTQNNKNDGNVMYNFTERYIAPGGVEKTFIHEVTFFDIQNGEWVKKFYHSVH